MRLSPPFAPQACADCPRRESIHPVTTPVTGITLRRRASAPGLGALAKLLGMHAEGAFLSIVIAECSMAVAGVVLFRQGRWKRKKI